MFRTETFLYRGKAMQPRKLRLCEIGDLSSNWENSKVDMNKYYDTPSMAYEVDEDFYNELKKDGFLCQVCNGKFYVGG